MNVFYFNNGRNRRMVFHAVRLLIMLTYLVVTNARAADNSPTADQPSEIRQWVERLGSDEFAERQQAERELTELGSAAFDVLFNAVDHPDTEVRLKSQYLLRSIPIPWSDAKTAESVAIIMADYGDEMLAVKRESTIYELSQVKPFVDAFPALARIARFEPEDRLAKLAALTMITNTNMDELPDASAMAEQLLAEVSPSQRPSAVWVHTYANYLQSPTANLHAWNEVIDAELAVLQEWPDRDTRQIVRDLVRWYADVLDNAGQRQEALVAMRKSVGIQKNDADDLMETLQWLLERDAWEMIDELAMKYASVFDYTPLLRYLHAESYLRRGNDELAQQTAKAAADFDSPNAAYTLSEAAITLQSMQLRHWAKSAYRAIIDSEQDASWLSLRAEILLAELCFDWREFQEAGDTYQILVDKLERPEVLALMEDLGGGTITDTSRGKEGVLSMLHLSRALQYREGADVQREHQHLRLAYQHDAENADILIAVYRATQPDDDWKAWATDIVSVQLKIFDEQLKAAKIRFQAAANDENRALLAQANNQYAWLASNTIGDYQKALAASLDSLRLRPDSSAYLDTLGRCYYAVGQLEEAVQTQQRAVELDPAVGAIRHQLEVFEAALEAAKKNSATE